MADAMQDVNRPKMKKPACAGPFHDRPCGPSTCHQALAKHLLKSASNVSLNFESRAIETAKRADPSADTSAWEREIDERVYRLYGLTPEEIKIVEAKG